MKEGIIKKISDSFKVKEMQSNERNEKMRA
jgi:hypothetical protein